MVDNSKNLLERLIAYGKSDIYPFHMPGHKRKKFGSFPNPYDIDITEINGFDNLHHAEGILKNSMEEAAASYGADKSYYLINGSTCGILSAMCACTKPGDEILMARNCHKAAYHGALLQNLKTRYLYPEFIEDFGISGGISVEDVKEMLKKYPDIKAVLIVSPTYEGIVSDVEAIAQVVHKHQIPLIVDEAHGAHFPFADHGFPKSAIECGADIIIQSLHKTLPCFTQTAILHVNFGLIDSIKLEQYLGIFQSSSPSYVFMSAIEQCIQYMHSKGREEMNAYESRLKSFYHRLENLKVLKVLSNDYIGENSAYDRDISKIVIFTGNSDISGDVLSKRLREEYHLEMEMSGPEYIIGMTTLMDTEEGLYRFAEALLELDRELACKNKCKNETKLLAKLPKTEIILSLSDAINSYGKPENLFESEGKISKEFIYLYPPGIPILAPGEKVSREILDRIEWYLKKGLSVQGLADSDVSSIITVAEE